MDINLFHTKASEFLGKLFIEIEKSKIDIKGCEIDHICYRTSSKKSYESFKQNISEIGELLIESIVGGRPIATYKLAQPIIFKEYVIDLVEVPAPKVGKETKDGFEHIEFVITEDFDHYMQRHEWISFKTKGSHKLFNPEIAFEMGEMSIKFHHYSLESVINVEKNNELWNFLEDDGFLEKYKNYKPIIRGNTSLGFEGKSIDLKIIFPKAAETLIIEEFTDKIVKKGSMIISFIFSDDQFSSLENRNFQIIARALKNSNNDFLQEINDQLSLGVSIEDALMTRLRIGSLEELTLSDVELSKKISKFM